jgi:hypothetical protein
VIGIVESCRRARYAMFRVVERECRRRQRRRCAEGTRPRGRLATSMFVECYRRRWTAGALVPKFALLNDEREVSGLTRLLA